MNDTTDDTAPVGGVRPGSGPSDTTGGDPAGTPTGAAGGGAAGGSTGQSGGHPGAQPPPHYRTQFDQIDRLRRSSSDRKLAGVAGGLGRHFNVDPVLFRVLFVVLTFFGGAGLLLYGALWLLVPEDGHAEAPVSTTPETRRIALVAILVVAALLAIGDSWGGWTFGWPLAIIAVFVAVYLLLQDRGRDDGAPLLPFNLSGAPGQGSAYPASQGAPMSTTYDSTSTGPSTGPGTEAGPSTGSGSEAGPSTGSGTGTETDVPPTTGYESDYRWTAAGGSDVPPWQPPTGEPPARPRRPRRTGTIWFWPTLALLAIGMGILGLYDANNSVPDGAYAALATAIIGGMLLVGAVRGRPGGLIFLGVLSTLALAANVVVGSEFGGDARQINATPTTAAAVSDQYQASVGEIRLDLTDVNDPKELAGRTIDLDLRTGYIHVVVPESLNLRVDAELEYAGGINVPNDDGGGWNPAVDRYYPGTPATNEQPLELDIDAKFGQITVEQR